MVDPVMVVAVRAYPNGTMRIVVPGCPPAKPRMTRRDKWAKRPCVLRHREWCDRVREAVGDSLPDASRVQYLDWTAVFEPPKSWSKRRRREAIGKLHRQRPDRDNIDKAVLDALYPDGDQAIACGRIAKQWGTVAHIEITLCMEETP